MVDLEFPPDGAWKRVARGVRQIVPRLLAYGVLFGLSLLFLTWSGAGYKLDRHFREIFHSRHRLNRIITPFKPPPEGFLPGAKEFAGLPLKEKPSVTPDSSTPPKPELTPEQRKKVTEILGPILGQVSIITPLLAATVPKQQRFSFSLIFATLLFAVFSGEGALRVARFFRRRRQTAPGSNILPAASFSESSSASSPPIIDKLHFSLTGPLMVAPGSAFIIDVWAHLAAQRQVVIEMASQEHGKEEIYLRSKGPSAIARGSVLAVQLQVEGLKIDEPQDFITWEGEIGKADFLLSVPEDAEQGSRPGKAQIYLQGQRIVKIEFSIKIGAALKGYHRLATRGEHHRKAFMSYAHADQDQVFPRIHGMQKVAPDLLVFLDAATLRSGEYYEEKLLEVIPTCDVFYLFWSRNASQSSWVEKEWRLALDRKGLDFIDPVPLASPEEIPPPPELASKHFNDWILAFMRTAEVSRIAKA